MQLRMAVQFVTCSVFRQSLVKFMGEAHRGVRGFVTDANNNPIEGASVKVQGRNVGFQTTQNGEFWRILLPGAYTMEVGGQMADPTPASVGVRAHERVLAEWVQWHVHSGVLRFWDMSRGTYYLADRFFV